MHAKVFRERRFFIPRGTGRCGGHSGREGGEAEDAGKMQTCLFVCLCGSVLSGCVCMFVFAWERKRKRRRDDGGFH